MSGSYLSLALHPSAYCIRIVRRHLYLPMSKSLSLVCSGWYFGTHCAIIHNICMKNRLSVRTLLVLTTYLQWLLHCTVVVFIDQWLQVMEIRKATKHCLWHEMSRCNLKLINLCVQCTWELISFSYLSTPETSGSHIGENPRFVFLIGIHKYTQSTLNNSFLIKSLALQAVSIRAFGTFLWSLKYILSWSVNFKCNKEFLVNLCRVINVLTS